MHVLWWLNQLEWIEWHILVVVSCVR